MVPFRWHPEFNWTLVKVPIKDLDRDDKMNDLVRSK
jgi:hypothetical protein